MTSQVSFWKRIGNLLRPTANGGRGINGHEDALPLVDETRAAATAVERAAPSTVERGEAHARDAGGTFAPRSNFSLLRWTRRDGQMPAREGYARVIELMDSMREHFRKQDGRAEQLADSVHRVAATIGQLTESQKTQGEFLCSIAAHADKSARSTATLSESLSQMPATLAAQADAVRSMMQQLERGQQADAQLVGSLDRFGSAVDSLRASGAAQVDTLQRIHASEREQKEALAALVRDQSRRFLIVMTVAAALGLGALAAMGITLALVLSR